MHDSLVLTTWANVGIEYQVHYNGRDQSGKEQGDIAQIFHAFSNFIVPMLLYRVEKQEVAIASPPAA